MFGSVLVHVVCVLLPPACAFLPDDCGSLVESSDRVFAGCGVFRCPEELAVLVHKCGCSGDCIFDDAVFRSGGP